MGCLGMFVCTHPLSVFLLILSLVNYICCGVAKYELYIICMNKSVCARMCLGLSSFPWHIKYRFVCGRGIQAL